jgi:hypothetical protein
MQFKFLGIQAMMVTCLPGREKCFYSSQTIQEKIRLDTSQDVGTCWNVTDGMSNSLVVSPKAHFDSTVLRTSAVIRSRVEQSMVGQATAAALDILTKFNSPRPLAQVITEQYLPIGHPVAVLGELRSVPLGAGHLKPSSWVTDGSLADLVAWLRWGPVRSYVVSGIGEHLKLSSCNSH